MLQGEIDILAAEVGLQSVALPEITTKVREKLQRLQRKIVRPVAALGKRRSDAEGSAHVGAGDQARKRVIRPAHSTEAGEGGRGKGTPLAERPQQVKRTRSEKAPRGKTTGDTSKPAPAGNKRPAGGDGQRPGFGRKRP
jgi:23S rRNA pseudouridine2605 synthase